ncbi:MAG: ABC transporter ATP-binding protein [Stackebrandtia sp.]
MNQAVDVEGLDVNRGGRQVLRGVTCQIPTGQVTGLLGPSGSGKTTLIRAIVGVQKIAGGAVRVMGLPAGHRRLRHNVGYLTQSPSVYSDLTVRANVRYFGALSGAKTADADAAIADVGLADAAGQLVGSLSGGQHARASLACALVCHPDLLILDEPTVGQDPLLRQELWEHFHRLADSGVTLLVSSHVMDEATRCDRLLLIRDGRLVADDTPTALRESTGEADLEQAFIHIVREMEMEGAR